MYDPTPSTMSQFQQKRNLVCTSSRRLPAAGTFGILRLPNELLNQILDLITDQATLAALALSSAHLKVLSVPRITKRVVFVADKEPQYSIALYQEIEQYLSIPQINASRALDPELLGPPPFLPGRYSLGVPPQARFLTEAVIWCENMNDITMHYLCAFLKSAKTLRLLELSGKLAPQVMAEVTRLEKLQGLYLTDTSSTALSRSLDPSLEACFLLHVWINESVTNNDESTSAARENMTQIPVPNVRGSKDLRFLTLVASVPLDDTLLTTLRTSNSNHQLLARFQPKMREIFQQEIISADRVSVALPAIDYCNNGVFRLRSHEASILATLPAVLSRSVPVDLAGGLRYLVTQITTPEDAAVLSRLTQLETLYVDLPRDSRDTVAAAMQHIRQLQSLKSLYIHEMYENYRYPVQDRSILYAEDIEGILRNLTGLMELEIPIYPIAVEKMEELSAFRFCNLPTIRLWPATVAASSARGVYDWIEPIVKAIVRQYGWDSDPTAWDRVKRLERITFKHHDGTCDWLIGTDALLLAMLQEASLISDDPSVLGLADGRTVWFEKNERYYFRPEEPSRLWLDKAGEALQRMDAEALEDL